MADRNITYFGRKVIYTDTAEITAANVANVLASALQTHRINSSDINYLYSYYKGNQPILYREKTIRPEINNLVVENRANEIVSFKVGYICGEPVQYVSHSSDEESANSVGRLNDIMAFLGKDSLDNDLFEWMYVCGVGYRFISVNKDSINLGIIPRLLGKVTSRDKDEDIPFNLITLDPRSTFVVRYSGISDESVMAVKYVEIDKDIIYSVWTKTDYFELKSPGLVISPQIIKHEKNVLGYIPVIEYPLNTSRLSPIEVVEGLLNAMNTVASDRANGIEQFIQSLMVLYNADISDEDIPKIRDAGIIKLKNIGDNKADIKMLSEQLNQAQTQTLVDYMYQTVLNIVGMPNRNGGSSTSDTGAATIVRDGWSTAEARAQSDEKKYKASEREALRVILHIMRSANMKDIPRLIDIDIKFTRRNYENIQSKSQVLVSMLNCEKIHPLLAFEHCGLFSDPESAYIMSMKHYDEQMEKWQPVEVSEEEEEYENASNLGEIRQTPKTEQTSDNE